MCHRGHGSLSRRCLPRIDDFQARVIKVSGITDHQVLRKLPGHIHDSPDGDAAVAFVLVEVHDAVLVRHQLMRSRHTGAWPARKIGIGKLFHLIVNQQPHTDCCTHVIPGDPGLDRIQIFTVFGPANDAPSRPSDFSISWSGFIPFPMGTGGMRG